MTTEGYVESGTSDFGGRGYNYTAAYYGANENMNSSRPMYGGLENATYVHTDYKEQQLGYDRQSGAPLYSVLWV